MKEVARSKGRGGRPKVDADLLRIQTIGVRVSVSESERLRHKAEQSGMVPAQFLRECALSKRLPSPPVPTINLEQYAELARLSANLNQLTKLANQGHTITVANDLLKRLTEETKQLRLALLGVERDHDR